MSKSSSSSSSWTSPPTRRELTLLLLCVTAFVAAYNADASLRLAGLPFARPPPAPVGPDGRRPAPLRDALEDDIFGTWDWDRGRVAGVKAAEGARVLHGAADGATYLRGEGRSGAQALWLQGVGEGRFGRGDGLGSTSVNDELVRWGDDVPRTELRQHVPGYSILDNVVLANGTFFVVADDPASMPPADAIAAARGAGWQVLSAQDARAQLGPYGGRMHGVTFLSYDADARALLALQRLHATLNLTSAATLPPPHRLLLPAASPFADARPAPDGPEPDTPRRRTALGLPHATLKAAFPSLAGVLFAPDLADYAALRAPLVLDRLVVADRAAGPLTALRAPADWLDAPRANLAALLGADADAGGVVYLASQDGAAGARLRDADHAALLDALRALGRRGVKVRVIDEHASWAERMRAVAQSTVVLSVAGAHGGDAVWLRRAGGALVELFAPGAFNRDWEAVVRSMDVRYVAWQGGRMYTGDEMPPVVGAAAHEDIAVDAQAVVRGIAELLGR
ncbi:hypothetical protein BC834DRAFT_139560 [Gloeopeniophorella convolvens]|nr:hypothetical protein BC834DRAFT_139560 [Gloeopeniophorella convolvens]